MSNNRLSITFTELRSKDVGPYLIFHSSFILYGTSFFQNLNSGNSGNRNRIVIDVTAQTKRVVSDYHYDKQTILTRFATP